MNEKFTALKSLPLQEFTCQLAIIHEYKRNRESVYKVKYVKIDSPLQRRLRNVLVKKIDASNTFEPYEFDSPDVEEDQVRSMSYESTDFYRIYEQLKELDQEIDTVKELDEILNTKSYLIVLRNTIGIQLVGFKVLPENWKLKRKKGLIPLLFREEMFEDLQKVDIFNISKELDFIYYDEFLFILSTKNFEKGLNFRNGMMSKADDFYDEVQEMKLFVNLEILKSKVGNNLRYLRKLATIRNLGYYKDDKFLKRLRKISTKRDWNIEFNKSQIVFTEDNLDDVLTLLQNKRLHSEITDETFDVESVKIVGGNE